MRSEAQSSEASTPAAMRASRIRSPAFCGPCFSWFSVSSAMTSNLLAFWGSAFGAKREQQAQGLLHRQAHNIEKTALNPFHQERAPSLDGVGAGLVHGFAALDVIL